ncbi:DNA processing protein [Aeromicrobium panaciterrae]|uniref:DNA processing protein n=1 Tax=Aeromicrobium panaciterrae TaxID=363861 RepID=A0ABU1UQG5_9ACTN|nr:DNA-processing protein DprA [Aeromicrobium panaciterrae]MDR7087421.1 DNA processing protein [Aeromicrobium panaciterrae]
MTEKQDRLALSLIAEPGDPRLRDLLAHHEPGRIVAGARGDSSVRVPAGWSDRALGMRTALDEVKARAKASGLRWLCPDDPGWPTSLSDLDHIEPLHGTAGAPIGLWIRGNGNLAQLTEESVAIVGARDCTTYGAESASELAADCTDAGFTIVSGAAFGVDGCAHRGALLMNKPTVAVLACGADVDYPAGHGALIAAIADTGLVVSEQMPGAHPLKGRFLSRNRIIAALSQGTVVIEAAVRSGSLNTLNWADQLGRTTMALPGPVTSKQSSGTHESIRTGKAVLVTNGKNVVEELRGLGAETSTPEAIPSTEFDRLPPAARKTLDGVDWRIGRSLTEIASGVRLTAREVQTSLDLLERRGLVVRFGSGWILARRADVG